MNLPQDERQLINTLQTLMREAEKNKLARTALTQLSENQYEGIQWYRFHRQFGYIFRDDEIMEGMILNYIRYCLDLAHASLTATVYSPEAYSLSNNPAQRRAEKIGSLILRDVFLRNGGFARQKRVAKTVLIRGDHCVKLEVDDRELDSLVLSTEQLEMFVARTGMQPLAADQLSENKWRATFRLGHVVERDISVNNIVVPNGFDEFKDAPWFAVTHYMPISQVIDFATKVGFQQIDRLVPARIRDNRAMNLSAEYPIITSTFSFDSREDSTEGHTFTQKSDMGVLTEFWSRDSAGFWSVIYLGNINREVYIGGQGGMADHPFVWYSCWDRPGKFWSMPHTSDLVQPQRTINKLASVQLRHFIKSAKDMLFVPKGARLTSVDAKEGTSIIEYSSMTGHAPQFVSVGSSIMQELSVLLAGYKGEMLQLAKVSEAMQGRVPDRVSSNTMTMQYNQDRSTIKYLAEKFEESERVKWGKILQIVRESPNFNLPRISAMLGSDKTALAMEWTNQDISANLMIRAKPSTISPETYEERKQLGMQLWQYGFFVPGEEGDQMRQMFNEFVQSGDTPAPQDEVVKYAEMQALQENFTIKSGAITVVPLGEFMGEDDSEVSAAMVMIDTQNGRPLIQPWQLHETHLKLHDELIQDPSTDEMVRQAAVFHKQEHEMQLAAIREQQTQAQMDLIARQSLAETTGPMVNTSISAKAKVESDKLKSSTAQGGRNSGKTRRKQ